MTGEQTVSLVGSYDTMALLVAAWDAGTVAAITDHFEVHIEAGVGPGRYHLIKVETTA